MTDSLASNQKLADELARVSTGNGYIDRLCHDSAITLASLSNQVEALSLMLDKRWQPVETAPKDGALFLGLTKKYGPLPIRWREFGEGSLAREAWNRGEGPIGGYWWSDEIHNWTQTCELTHWMPLPELPRP